jgi:hypothetical protein
MCGRVTICRRAVLRTFPRSFHFFGMRMLAMLPLVLLGSIQAQQRIDVTVHQEPSLLQMFSETMQESTRAAERSRELQIQQGYLDLARQQAEDARRAREQSHPLQDRVLDDEFGFRTARRDWAKWKINQDVMDAFVHGRAAHPDFDVLLPPARIYEVLLDAKQFSAFSNGTAEIQPRPGEAFKLFGGRVEGRNVELVPN